MATTTRLRTVRARPAADRSSAGRTRARRRLTGRVAVDAGLPAFSALHLVPLLWMVPAPVDAHADFRLSVPSPTGGNFRRILET
jgi:multiple sugar transport system permease protein